MTENVEIYVALLEEGVSVWRPVRAEHIGGDIYRISEQPYDAETEHWEFIPGETVQCGTVAIDGGEVLAAIAAGP